MHKGHMKSLKRDLDEIPSVNMFTTPHTYRRAMSNPMIKLTNAKQEDYEMKLTRSFPVEIIQGSKNLIRPQNLDNRLPKRLLEALSLFPRYGSETHLSSTLSNTLSKMHTVSGTSIVKTKHRKHKRKIKKINSVETPSLILSDSSYHDAIKTIDEFPLYRVINDAVGDLAGLMSANILKKSGKQKEVPFTVAESKTESALEDSSVVIPHESDALSSQSHLASKGVSLSLKPIPPDISPYLKNKCSLWRLQSKKRLSIQTSLSVNPVSEIKEESQLDNKVVNDDDEAQVQLQPNNQSKLIKTLMEECTPRNTIYRNIRKSIFPFRINPKDFPDIHAADVRNSKHFLQTLTGHDKVMLNMRPSMVKIHRHLVQQHVKEVESRQKKLEENETKRLRKLQVQGVVHTNYNEAESATDNVKLAEKPHLTYNSVRPIFNENPFANAYKCMVKQFNRDLNMKEKEEEDVASIGEVSFISSSSSYEKNLGDVYNTVKELRSSQSSMEIDNGSVEPKNQTCIRYMLSVNQLLNDMERESHMSAIYESSEPLMIKTQKTAENPALMSRA